MIEKIYLAQAIQALKSSRPTSKQNSVRRALTEIPVTKVTIEVAKSYKGSVAQGMLTVFTPSLGIDCGFLGFREGEEYIVYANQQNDLLPLLAPQVVGLEQPNTFWTNQCTRTKVFSQLEANELLEVANARINLYYQNFGLEQYKDLTMQLDALGVSLPTQTSADLYAAQKLNELLYKINHDYLINVGMSLGLDSIKVIQFDYQRVSTNRLHKNTPILIKHNLLAEASHKKYLIATIQTSLDRSIILSYSEKKKAIILAYCKNGIFDGDYFEYNLEGILLVKGQFLPKQNEQIHIKSLQNSHQELLPAHEGYKANAIKTGTWWYFNENGTVIKKENY